MSERENGGKKPFQIPWAPFISAAVPIVAGVVWMANIEGRMRIAAVKNADRIEHVENLSNVRIAQLRGADQEIIALLSEVRRTQTAIRETQNDIKSTQKDIRTAQQSILRELTTNWRSKNP